MLEAQCHEFSSFWTLTYSDDYLPLDGSLDPRHTELWLKRLRAKLGKSRFLRYYLVGEYGDETFRPHYHPALFGLSSLESDLVRETWGQGNVYSGELNEKSAAYIAGYVVKKMTSHEDPRLKGKHPEFARMSRRPGIGALAAPVIADALNSSAGARLVSAEGDVPTSLKHGSKNLPLGRYLRTKLREEMGFETTGGQKKPEEKRYEEMSALLEASGSRSRYLTEKPFIDYQKILQVEGKAKIWKKKGKL